MSILESWKTSETFDTLGAIKWILRHFNRHFIICISIISNIIIIILYIIINNF